MHKHNSSCLRVSENFLLLSFVMSDHNDQKIVGI